jgi:hypothetical protein
VRKTSNGLKEKKMKIIRPLTCCIDYNLIKKTFDTKKHMAGREHFR